MALTIGLGAAIFTIWDTALATNLPLPEGDQIVANSAVLLFVLAGMYTLTAFNRATVA